MLVVLVVDNKLVLYFSTSHTTIHLDNNKQKNTQRIKQYKKKTLDKLDYRFYVDISNICSVTPSKWLPVVVVVVLQLAPTSDRL